MSSYTDHDFHPALQLTFGAATATLQERNAKNGYQDNWRQSALGVRGSFVHLFSKTERLKRQIWDKPPEEWELDAAMDSALDAINYAAFVHALLRDEKSKRESAQRKAESKTPAETYVRPDPHDIH